MAQPRLHETHTQLVCQYSFTDRSCTLHLNFVIIVHEDVLVTKDVFSVDFFLQDDVM